MKIALIIEHFDATRGAAEHLAVWLANSLAKRGHDVHVICHDVSARINRYRQATLRASHDADLSFRAHPPAEVAHDGIHIHKLRGMRVNTGFGFRRFGMRARQWCTKHKPDVVHSLTVAFAGDIYQPCAGVYAAMQNQAAASRATEKAATFKRVMLQLSGKQRTLLALEKRAALANVARRPNEPRRILCQCTMMRDQFKRHYGIDKPRLVHLATPRMEIPGTAGSTSTSQQAAEERAWFRGHFRLAPDDRVALFVGHDFRRKGLRYAIETIARTQTGWKLLVVGLGKAREYVELADLLGIGDQNEPGKARVLFVGPTRQMDRVYAAADALLLPTFYDPFGLVGIEALGHGLPVISTEFLGSGDLVRQHDAGAIVPTPKAVAEMAAALDALPTRGTPAYDELAARARKASSGVSPEGYLEKLIAMYEEVRRERR
jgi:UDP-glucose:(heptosyl)LPS alpha-1,3-glucosyltransferase